jgi:3-phenylpropionate/cinnamic acid dioxygenase small subunit
MNTRGEIENLLYRVARYLDEKDLEGVESCYTKASQVTINIASKGISEELKDRHSFMAMVRARVAEQQDNRLHVITNVEIFNETEATAEAISYLTLLSSSKGSMKLLTGGVYRDSLVKQGSSWLIDKRQLDLASPY